MRDINNEIFVWLCKVTRKANRDPEYVTAIMKPEKQKAREVMCSAYQTLEPWQKMYLSNIDKTGL